MPLHHVVVSARDAEPRQLMLVLHGILGQGLNWRGVARRLAKARPEWGFVLVDLRAHGDSRDVPPPDSLEAAAGDLVALIETLELPVRGVLGHSFGGKVAVELVRQRPDGLRSLVVVDSLPGDRPDRRGSEGTERVITMLEGLPARFDDREGFVSHVTGLGFGTPLARWLAQSLDKIEDGVRFGLDVARIRTLLDGYFERDLWPVLDPPPEGVIADLVIGGRSTVWSAAERERGIALQRAYPDQVRVTVLAEADHWVHVDDPEGLHRVVEEAMS
ncbi:MAG: alpha/beta fold hydrolase [Sandaracinaceae bacterium]